jgi:hypothetical protein
VNTVENTNDFGRASTLYHQEQVWIRNRKTVLGSTSGTRIERDMAGRVNEDDVQSRYMTSNDTYLEGTPGCSNAAPTFINRSLSL